MFLMFCQKYQLYSYTNAIMKLHSIVLNYTVPQFSLVCRYTDAASDINRSTSQMSEMSDKSVGVY